MKRRFHNYKGDKMIEESYITCILVDGTFIEFNKLCNQVKEFATDAFAFNRNNFKTDCYITLMIIPKMQIKQIFFNHTENEINEIIGEQTV